MMAELDRRAPQRLEFGKFFRNDLDRPLSRNCERLFLDGVNKPSHRRAAHFHGRNPTGELCTPTPCCFDKVGRLECLQVGFPKVDNYAARPTRIRAPVC
jgi:hypothetical protein